MAYTNMADKVERCINFIENWLEREPEKIVGLDVEYTNDKSGSTQMVAVIQLCMGRNCLVYQISAADKP